MLTFRIAITATVMAFITVLAACLIFIQVATYRAATAAAAAAAMDAASTNTLNRLEAEVSAVGTLVRVLASNPSLTNSDDRSEVGPAIALFKAALHELPQADSIYVGYDNGCWLQVRRLDVLGPTERQRLGAPPGAVHNLNLVRPTPAGDLPMRRIFEDEWGNKIDQLDLWNYGYDVRNRGLVPRYNAGGPCCCFVTVRLIQYRYSDDHSKRAFAGQRTGGYRCRPEARQIQRISLRAATR